MDLKKLLKRRTYRGIYRLNMDMMFEAYLTHESGHLEPEDIPHTNNPVWILGRKYSAVHDLEQIRRDIRSRLWFSYRKGFVPIGDTGLTSDKGWGCMLRCGQMLIAQALLFLHLGRDWVWSPGTRDRTYLKILRMFEDRRTAPYSIHQIALTGASEGKEVGEWFGPNTVAQVLRKLSAYDEWSSLVIHVALDNTLVINEIRESCSGSSSDSRGARSRGGYWKPLLLVIPLRLGISEINPVYVQGLKTCFTFKQSLGVIGGKPNHALYFVGCVGNDVIFLDPHTTQQIGSINNKDEDSEKKLDCSYHCQQASRLHILNMDPSVAVSFFCRNETEFDQLCQQIRDHLVVPEKQPLFEICDNRQEKWTPQEDTAQEALGAAASTFYPDRQLDDSDEDFELLG
ncbi:cysteine protease ATG4B isoform X2 [Nilaparvata lugens]|uniref:cysteine protease ATG4B isoform X2 n=1 Tax=Nilaparvata lugens TaxID=108931 RepID=UPI000B996F57|nr:cysteine protease ATG4B isoform X2 [Nilaparvata lugens]XP_039280000.1 cysteine protease ATG4B isoform X2 [Nilaparvata lugens]